MSKRSTDDDLPALLEDLSRTLDRLQRELDDQRPERAPSRPDRSDDERGRRGVPRRRDRDRPTVPPIPRPGEFLRFTEEYTIPALIAFLEANVRALELLRGLLRLLDRGEASERRVESVGRRTLDGVDDLLGEVQGALEGDPSNPEARDLLADARSLRAEIDDRMAGGAVRRRSDRAGDDEGPRRGARRDRGRSDDDAPITIDVTDGDEDRDRSGRADRERRRGGDRRDTARRRRDEVDVDAELDSLRERVRGEGADGDAEGDDGPGAVDDSGDGGRSDDGDEEDGDET